MNRGAYDLRMKPIDFNDLEYDDPNAYRGFKVLLDGAHAREHLGYCHY